MEPVSLALGVLPLLGVAVKGYRAIRKKSKVFSHYSREVKQVHKSLDWQREIFFHEIHLLIRPILDDDSLIDEMIKNPEHLEWRADGLEVDMRKLLGRSYDTCEEIIGDIGAAIQHLEDQLECFDDLTARLYKGESLKDGIRRLRGAVKISWDKEDYNDSLEDLRKLVDNLRRIREQAVELSKPNITIQNTQPRKKVRVEYLEFAAVRAASKAFHEALTTEWLDPSPLRITRQSHHTVRLFLDAKGKEEVHMNVIIACHTNDTIVSSSACPNLRKLQVRSQAVNEWSHSELNPPPDGSRNLADCEDGRSKRRKVRFEHDCTSLNDQNFSEVSTLVHRIAFPSLNGQDMCTILCKHPGLDRKRNTSCIGQLGDATTRGYLHSFYPGIGSLIPPSNIKPVQQILIEDLERSLTMVEQLKLARELVVAVLKFHSTPWLRDFFSLNDIFLSRESRNITSDLQTLHVGLDIARRIREEESGDTLETMDLTTLEDERQSRERSLEDARLEHGIRNLTLWNLGVILLQIGLWSKIEFAYDVVTVRRLCARSAQLGPRYQDLTKKCIECDFGYGDDLSKPRLQQAVYEGLVGQLSDMISSLDIVDDEASEQ